jgi:hypothetical protein
MTALALVTPSRHIAAARRAALLTAFALALAALALPDCCLSGRHAAGFGMEALAGICHAAR